MSTYRKEVEITDTGMVIASVFRDSGTRVGVEFFTSFLNTVAAIERNAVRAHKWADAYAAMCARQEYGQGA